MHKRWLVPVFALVVLPCLLLPARAEETGYIRVTLEEAAAREPGGIDMYRVAEVAEGGYRIYDVFGGGFIREEDARSPHLAQWLGELTADLPSFHSGLDVTGSADFRDLAPGLYLLTQREAQNGIFPFLIPLPMEGEWALQAYPQAMLITGNIPMTGDSWSPLPGVLGMLFSGTGLILCLVKSRKTRKV